MFDHVAGFLGTIEILYRRFVFKPNLKSAMHSGIFSGLIILNCPPIMKRNQLLNSDKNADMFLICSCIYHFVHALIVYHKTFFLGQIKTLIKQA